MYHATHPRNVVDIIENGFNRSQGAERNLLFGDGLYVSRDIEKTLGYGDVCFKLLVYPGKTLRVESLEDPLRTTWHKKFSSAWLPPNHAVSTRHPGREETCVKSSTQVRILGISYGHELLEPATKARLRDLFGTGDSLDKHENRVLDQMLEDLGIMYSCVVHQGSQSFLEVDGSSVKVADWNGRDSQLWSRTWDNCLENKKTGQVLSSPDGHSLEMTEVDQEGNKKQKWRLNEKGRMIHKASARLLSLAGQGRGQGQLELCQYSGAERDTWKFRCLDLVTRHTDKFVEYTPWRDMITWT